MPVEVAQVPVDFDPVRENPNKFAQLRRLIQENGLLEKQPRYYAFKIPLTVILLVPGVALLVLTDALWVQLLNAVYLAFVFTQFGFICHDAGHRQIFRSAAKEDFLGLLFVPIVGISFSWWMDTHNRHHCHPNQLGSDPAIEFDFFAFSDKQARSKGGWLRSLVRYQAFYFLPLMLAYPVMMRIESVKFLLKGNPRQPILESILFLLHFPLYYGLVFSQLPLWTALAFILVQQSLFSLLLVSAFAPNHKGMVVLEEDHPLDYLHQQVCTAQNLQSHPFTDFWFGCLNYQIEHHLFPNMARNKLKAAQKIIRPFCKENSIPYQETTASRCHWEILKFLHQASAPLRQKKT